MKYVVCPHCGYKMPFRVMPGAVCHGIWVKCKGRKCGKEFEILISGNK